MLTAIRQWVVRTMMKSKGETGIVKTLPNKDLIELNTQITAQRLMQNGVDPLSLKNADQVENAIIAIESRPKVQEGIKSTKSADVFDLKGKKIKDTDNIMGGEEVKETEAQIKRRLEKGNKEGIARIKEKKFRGPVETTENMPGFGKLNVEIDYSASLDNPSYFGDAKNMFGEPARSGSEYFKEIKQFHLNQINRKKREMVPPTHPNYKILKKSLQDQEDSLTAAQIAEELGGNENMYDFLRSQQIYNPKAKPLKKSDYVKDADDQKSSYDDGPADFDPDADNETFATGGRAGFKEGNKKITIDAAGSKSGKQQIMGAPEGITADRESIDAIIKADIPISEKIDLLAKYQYGKGRTRIERDGQEIFLDEGGFKSRDIGLGFNKEGEGIGGTLTYNLESGEPEFNIGFRKRFNEGGRIGFAKGLSKILLGRRDFLKTLFGNTKKNRKNRKLQELIEEYRELQKSMEKNPQFKFPKRGDPEFDDTMLDIESKLAKDRVKSAAGGRIGLKDGMSRRKFMQIMGGLAAIPIVGKFFKAGKVATKAAPIVKTPPVPGKPKWFDALVNKVISEGDDVTKQLATKEREIVHTVKLTDEPKLGYVSAQNDQVTVYRDLDDGTVRVEYSSVDNMSEAPVNLTFKPGMADETTKVKPADTFQADEIVPESRVVGPDDFEIEDAVDEFDNVVDLNSDVSKLKEFAGEKLTTKEIVEGINKRKRSKAITEDRGEAADFMTSRQGDYDPSGDEFASGGIARMLGE